MFSKSSPSILALQVGLLPPYWYVLTRGVYLLMGKSQGTCAVISRLSNLTNLRLQVCTCPSVRNCAMSQGLLDVERIRQYPGQIQVARRVKVQVPGKHFPQLTTAEQKQFFEGTAVE